MNKKTYRDRLYKLLQALVNRGAIIVLLVLSEFAWLFLVTYRLSAYYPLVRAVLGIVSVLVVWGIMVGEQNPAYKLSLSILILALPFVGIPFYLMTGNFRVGMRRMMRRGAVQHARIKAYFSGTPEAEEKIRGTDERVFRQTSYLKYQGYPVYENTQVTYLPDGDRYFEALTDELSKAEHFIFIEYFIIKRGEIWDRVLPILKQKAAAGVEVRLIFDDFGCMFWLPNHYEKELARFGIRTRVFNPMNPIFSIVMNHRDHRKVVVIDGYTGFTGGINIADEYADLKRPYGYWKDNGVMLKGEAVWNMTGMFLEMWNTMGSADRDFEKYRPDRWHKRAFESDGFVLPYADNPTDRENIGETVYMNIISQAKRYVYIMTPYLIVDNEMITALTAAAKSGVDVRIITPGIPDKKIVYLLTQSYFGQLVRAGVKVYRFRPGFVHAKMFVCDDEIGTVGSVNMDYRSLYLHYECGVWMYRSSCIRSMLADFLVTQGRCDEITEGMLRKKPLIVRALQVVLRIFAPLC